MSFVETCRKHGQYHADYICGDCVADSLARIEELEAEVAKLKKLAVAAPRMQEALTLMMAIYPQQMRGSIVEDILNELDKGDAK